MVYICFPVIKSHCTGSPVEIFLHPGGKGVLASARVLGTFSSCLFTFLTWVLVEVTSTVELTSNLTLKSISAVFLEWFFNHNNAREWLGVLGSVPLPLLGFALKSVDSWVSYVSLQKVRFWDLGKISTWKPPRENNTFLSLDPFIKDKGEWVSQTAESQILVSCLLCARKRGQSDQWPAQPQPEGGSHLVWKTNMEKVTLSSHQQSKEPRR